MPVINTEYDEESDWPIPLVNPVEFESESPNYQGLKQFTTTDGKKFFAAGSTVLSLVPGTYNIKVDNSAGICFQKINIATDGLLRFPNSNSEKVIEEISKFWDRESVFNKYNLNYKRGIFLYGPPGSGKSSTIQIVSEDVVKRNGVVFKFNNPSVFVEGIRIFREIQPDTPVVVLMEDIDSTIEAFNESEVLNILDGVDQASKIVFLATSNYPELLSQRLLNRPSRFDKRFKMEHPDENARRLYFDNLIDDEAIENSSIDIDQWVAETENMSIAHLKELFVTVCILGNSYSDSLEALRGMSNIPRSDADYDKKVGFGANSGGKGWR